MIPVRVTTKYCNADFSDFVSNNTYIFRELLPNTDDAFQSSYQIILTL